MAGLIKRPLLIMFLLLFYQMLVSKAEPLLELVTRVCRDDRVNNQTIYAQNYDIILERLAEGMSVRGYSFGEMGDPPNRVFVFSQCMGDLNTKECSMCFNEIKDILSGCFPSSGGRIFYNGCFIRAENYYFFNHTVEPDDLRVMNYFFLYYIFFIYMHELLMMMMMITCMELAGHVHICIFMQRCSDGLDLRKEYTDVGRKQIADLVKVTMENDGFGAVYKKSNEVSFYASATCWKTLNSTLCQECVQNAADSCAACLPSAEGRVLNSGCTVRYADYDFGNKPDVRRAKVFNTAEILLTYATYVLVGLAVSVFVVMVGIYAGKAAYRRKIRRLKKKVKGRRLDIASSKKGLKFLEFNYLTLEKATEGFNDAHKLGQGGFGEVFKGTLGDGREIAIKRLFATGKSQTEEICNEIDIISSAQHKNLVRFLGCCFTESNSFLVYEFLVNKSLDQFIFDSERSKELDWKKRLQIMIGSAEGLEYLHKGCQMRIIHRDIKASNILLDSKWIPKIADFGLARFSSAGSNVPGVAIAGTFGYLAPEYLAQGRLTEKVDVYSFGVLALEIISGVRNNKLRSNDSFETLVAHVWKHYQSNTVSEIIENSLANEDFGDIERIVQVGLLCTQEVPSLRPNMTMVIQMLKQNDFELPTPTKPPFIDENLELSSSFDSCRWQPSCIPDLCSPHIERET
ncbi:cysteine-rich receptor-like protein kinase 46 [Humulus lupulus]|uniref:cysteine-rich receptor-like protein kinase 46 n=1 Tax=Humulus lupulus TaxID=3486 RepID=UPI002B400954|nr:cysteine-rich receptor-like protein kinase 46 [Humulus lupulus]